ncbi:rRNA maturation RNase YbeY [Mesoplasma corruscae]|uniref:Endoribonuclease YbeY n=1 Tax=Mesoplasma corruscae TaxID=216874 RepID=A0A2S5RGJ1_9MOLU|nr:rRNA maturation RNase YbeY [Mesoplasma corruscae]PPE06411.1 16S rRNA maturation RNase YbeY [Mesoplasma corruscae]
MIDIYFTNSTNKKTKDWEKLAIELLSTAYTVLKLKNEVNLSINFVDSKEALEINKKFRNKTYIPDVLSFPIQMSKQEIEIVGIQEIGDIFICPEEAHKKSLKYNHTDKEEMAFLIVHGFLHLMGYDHEVNEEQEAIMFKLQDQILNLNNVEYKITFIEEDYLREEN